MSKFEEELRALIEQAHGAGEIKSCWETGAPYATNELYYGSEGDLELAVSEFVKKYDMGG